MVHNLTIHKKLNKWKLATLDGLGRYSALDYKFPKFSSPEQIFVWGFMKSIKYSICENSNNL